MNDSLHYNGQKNCLTEQFKAIKENFPPELLTLTQWVCWQYDGKKKIPKNPKTGGNAMPNKSNTWGTFDEACQTATSRGLDGIGLMFDGDIFGIDLDDCRDAQTKEIDKPALAICKQFPSYAEITPSGRGLHILCKGTLPEGLSGKREGKIEIYARGRFFTVTGDVFQFSQVLADCTNEVKELLHKTTNPTREVHSPSGQDIPDAEVLQSIENSGDASVFLSLYEGLWKKADGGHSDFPSQSEADLTFCIIVARWTGCNSEQIDRFYRQSKLFRPKWDEMHGEDTYGNTTISKSIKAVLDEPVQPYRLIRQGAVLNALSKAILDLSYKKSKHQLEACTGKLSIRIQNSGTESILKDSKDGQASRIISCTVSRLLDVILLESANTGSGTKELNFSLERFMKYCGLNDKRAAGKQVREDLQILTSISCTYIGNNRTGTSKDQKLLSVGTIRRGFIKVVFDEGFHKQYLKRNMVMPYPMVLLRFNPHKERSSYQLLRKLCEHKNMNYTKSNADIVSVKTLLDACSAIPRVEDVRDNDGHIKTRIIEAFIQSMNRLSEVMIYRFCHEGGRPLRPDEWPIKRYEDFIQLLILVQWHEYPPREPKNIKRDKIDGK